MLHTMNSSKTIWARLALLGVGIGVSAVIANHFEKRYQVHEEKIMTRPVFDPPGLKYAQTVPPEQGAVRGWVYGMSPPPKRPGTKRILAVGDSITWGLGVRLDEAWPAELERMLPNSEVFNLGMCGYDAEQGVSLITGHLAEWQPDLVIWGHYTNDVDPTFLMFGAHDEHPVFVGTSIPEPARMLPEWISLWLVRHSAMFRQVQAAKLARVLASGHTPTPPSNWYTNQLQALRKWSHDNKTEVIAVAIPDHTQASPTRCTEFISEKDCGDQMRDYARIRDALSQSGLTWVDGQVIYAQSGQPHFMGADRDSGHPTPTGHRVLAAGLAPVVKSKLAK